MTSEEIASYLNQIDKTDDWRVEGMKITNGVTSFTWEMCTDLMELLGDDGVLSELVSAIESERRR